ncbi:heme oxygenase-like protein, partial [Cryphonectria parasitica EP155]
MAGDRSSSASNGDPRSLAHQINVAIASSHTKINRLILDRMPRAVPPHTSNPSAYITGLIHIGAVYIAFESLWQSILGIHSDIAPVPYVFPFSADPCQHDETPQITERTRQILEEAYWPNMVRVDRIKADIRAMTGWPAHVIDEQIRSAGTSGRLGKFTLHVRDSVLAKPHLLLAYAYSLYLALLSGGSYIRAELLCLKPQFWHETPTPIRPHMVGCRPQHASSAGRERLSTFEDNSSIKIPLDFLDFDPPLGEHPRQQCKELKAEFKTRFARAEQLLAGPERQDIVEESAAIFHHLEGVVGQLDAIFGTSQAQGFGGQKASHAPTYSTRVSNIGSRLRDSIAIAKVRLLG